MEAKLKLMTPDDVVWYRLFLMPTEQVHFEKEEVLQNYIKKILSHLAPLLVQYIWQNQSFNLSYKPRKEDVPAHIGGATNFGDNIEDEWFIVYLIKTITETFPELVARCFIVVVNCTLFLFLKILQSWHCFQLVAPPSLRLYWYPEKISSNLHRAYCYVPAGIAVVLKQHPQLIASAVQAFYCRDPVDVKTCSTFKTFLPETRVMTLVTFTRCLYAQLLQQRFSPDRHSGYVLPSPSQNHYKAHDLGMKLAYGFEILCSKFTTPLESKNPITKDTLWNGFLMNLKKSDYFKGELEGSVKYKELLQVAENYFQQSVATPESSSSYSPGEKIMSLLQSIPYSVEELRKEEDSLPPEDDDSWLDISSEKLDQLLRDASGQSEFTSNKQEKDDKYDLSEVTHSMKAFISKVSTHEGAEVPWSSCEAPVQFDVQSFTTALERILGGDDDNDDDLDTDDLEEDENYLNNSSDSDNEGKDHSDVASAEALKTFHAYMKEMDMELAVTNIGKSFSKQKQMDAKEALNPLKDGESDSEGGDNADSELQPVDVDFNLVANLLESYNSQTGLAGPGSNILQSMGVQLPDDHDH
ncbi:protein ecdysoneless homolog isoform X2 [Protopterus annectens]|uniref:protein ecdysoneless homolog isoform X2 n=1 Tax=Protopterus annectens TaxID=7888 RepID=UPI001CFBF086|nr:protein ecdysoneless homolog isoform X2 [Protopterus annectens]